MNSMMTEFLSSAGEQAAVVLAEQNIANAAKVRRKKEQAENDQALQEIIGKELDPVLDILRNLPQIGGKSFTVSIVDNMFDDTAKAEYVLSVAYQQPQSRPALRHAPSRPLRRPRRDAPAAPPRAA